MWNSPWLLVLETVYRIEPPVPPFTLVKQHDIISASESVARTILSHSQDRVDTHSATARSSSELCPRHAYSMDSSLQSTLILLLLSFLALNGIRYWRRVPYGSKVGSLTWITHRGIPLSYTPGFAALTTQRSCRIPHEGSPRHALCHIPFLGRESTFAPLTIAAVLLWTSTLSEVVLCRRSVVESPSYDQKQKDHMSSHGVTA